ncbi:uncharacterized protein APUU_21928A [Aspergillus puulaauensis]|uniref:Uncharacterized protein n=1 Tax=Aspergillus puulaauensis TaxID=1220207 RepID=A0A7R7XHE7_9EURO|nr:uncharacterized protein APUU_21928A [Aspergillus puulaauensis]BCS21496.1 hypothetical protein APUU_21928A [Aspergillus puulaauensis]
MPFPVIEKLSLHNLHKIIRKSRQMRSNRLFSSAKESTMFKVMNCYVFSILQTLNGPDLSSWLPGPCPNASELMCEPIIATVQTKHLFIESQRLDIRRQMVLNLRILSVIAWTAGNQTNWHSKTTQSPELRQRSTEP